MKFFIVAQVALKKIDVELGLTLSLQALFRVLGGLELATPRPGGAPC